MGFKPHDLETERRLALPRPPTPHADAPRPPRERFSPSTGSGQSRPRPWTGQMGRFLPYRGRLPNARFGRRGRPRPPNRSGPGRGRPRATHHGLHAQNQGSRPSAGLMENPAWGRFPEYTTNRLSGTAGWSGLQAPCPSNSLRSRRYRCRSGPWPPACPSGSRSPN